MLRWPEGLDAQRFLYQYWQKAPLFLPQALPDLVSPLDPDELAGLACDPDIESRIVIENSDPPWSLENGPFEPKRFARLPQTGWSLLVQDVDKHVPDTTRLREGFRFLPDWRFDDLMASYAPPGGSVGPHVDAYDVFLIQGLGRRRWQVDPSPRSNRRVPGTRLDLLADFHAIHEWVAEPGDVLYLPPALPTMVWRWTTASPGRWVSEARLPLMSFRPWRIPRLPGRSATPIPTWSPKRRPTA